MKTDIKKDLENKLKDLLYQKKATDKAMTQAEKMGFDSDEDIEYYGANQGRNDVLIETITWLKGMIVKVK